MYLLKKLQQYGLSWVARRTVREFIRPTTRWGLIFKPFTKFFYHGLSRPIHFVCTQWRAKKSTDQTLYFFYDLEVEPISYDFVWALCMANTRREELGLAFLHIVLVPGTYQGLRKELPGYDQAVPYDARVWRIYSILLPAVQLLACRPGLTFCTTRGQAAWIQSKQANFIYPTAYNVTFPVPHAPELAVIHGPKCMTLRADKQAKAYVSEWLNQHAMHRKVIVLTLRQYAYTPERNSNVQAWAQFAASLDSSQFFIVFIADTEQSLKAIPPELQAFCFFDPACWNVNLRAALYELADLNLGVNTGPMSLCWFNPRCRYITFKVAVKNVPQVPLKMITDKGFVPGRSPAFAHPFQKWVWEDDNFDVISREFRLMWHNMAHNMDLMSEVC